MEGLIELSVAMAMKHKTTNNLLFGLSGMSTTLESILGAGKEKHYILFKFNARTDKVFTKMIATITKNRLAFFKWSGRQAKNRHEKWKNI